MNNIKGPAIFLAQFIQDIAPYNNFADLCCWASKHGYKGVQIPSWDKRCIDLKRAAESKTYADEIKGIAESNGLHITELSSHLQGQLVAVHSAYNVLFDGFAPKELHNKPAERSAWARQQLVYAAQASKHLGLTSHATFSGALLWPYVYPWPQRPAGLVEEGFKELARRWQPILDEFDSCGVDVCYELHPGEDLHDGISFERFLASVNHHKRACILYDPSHFLLQGMDYLAFIDFYHQYIKAFHVKDAELRPNGKQGVYGGYADWKERAGRFRSLGDGMIDFKTIFSKLTQYDCSVWAVLEWECALKDSEVGAKEGVQFINDHIIQVTKRAFDDFAGGKLSEKQAHQILGI